MCSYETIFNSFGKLIDSYRVRNPMDMVASFPSVFLADVIWHTVKLLRTISITQNLHYTLKKCYSKNQLLMETYDRNVGLQNKFRFF
jgi:hypothetical protein